MATDNSASQKWKELAEFLRDRLTAKPTRLINWTEDKTSSFRIEGDGDTRYTKIFHVDPETRKWFDGEDLTLILHWRENAHVDNGWWLEPLKVHVADVDSDTPGFPQPALVFDTIHIGMFSAKCVGVRSSFTKDDPSTLETEYEFAAIRGKQFVGHWSLTDTFGCDRIFTTVQWLNRPGGPAIVGELISKVQTTISFWHMSSEMVGQCEKWLRILDQPSGSNTVNIYVDSLRPGGSRELTMALDELQSLGLACGMGTRHGFFQESAREIISFGAFNETEVLQVLLLCKFKEKFDLGYKMGEERERINLVEVYKLAHEQQIGDPLLRKCEIYLLQNALVLARFNAWHEIVQMRDELELYDLPVLKMGMRLIAQEHQWRGIDEDVVKQALMNF